MWVEHGHDGGHEDSSDRCWMHHVGVACEMGNRKNIGAANGGEIFHEAIYDFVEKVVHKTGSPNDCSE